MLVRAGEEPRKVPLASLQDYPQLLARMAHWGGLSFEASDDEEAALFHQLFDYIENKKPIHEPATLLPLADLYGVTDCVQACYESLIQDQEQYEIEALWDLLLTHAHFEGSDDIVKKELNCQLEGACKKRDFQKVDCWLKVFEKHEVQCNIDDYIQTLQLFRILWEYAKREKNSHLKEVCKRHLRQHPNPFVIYNLWGIMNFPKELEEA